MQLIKPKTLSLITKPYRFRRQDYLAVGAVAIFQLQRSEQELNALLPEAEFLGKCHEAIGRNLFELGINKHGAEFLVAGSAFAPQGKALDQMRVSITVANRSKILDVHGDQILEQGLLGSRKTRPEPFTEMPLSYALAYGGKSFAANPLGKGHEPGKQRPLPNVVYAGNKRKQKQQPAALCASGIDWPLKIKLAGTYDAAWQQDEAPGFPRDIDWNYFMLGADDQRFPEPLQGGEAYRIEGMHPGLPVLEGRLPELRFRIFVSNDPLSGSGLRELQTHIDTVWFFPDRNLGLLIARGVTPVADSEAMDIGALLLACENLSDARREQSWYQQVMKLRCDRSTALASAFNEAQLLPVRSAGEQELRAADKAAWREQKSKSAAADRAALLAEIGARLGVEEEVVALAQAAQDKEAGKEKTGALQKFAALPDPSLLLSPQELQTGDFDMTELFSVLDEMHTQTKAMVEQVKVCAAENIKLAKAPQTALLKHIAGIAALAAPFTRAEAAPAPDARLLEQALQKLKTRTSVQIRGIADPEQLGSALASMRLPAASTSGLADPQSGKVDQDKLTALKDETDLLSAKALRLARLQSPEYCGTRTDDPAMQATLALQARTLFCELLEAGADLRGRDFAGADLSGLDLSGLDLSELMLEHSKLSDCCFIGSKLYGAVLTGATVDRCNFSAADLRRSNLSALAGTACSFAGCRLDHAIMMNLKLDGSCWRGAELRNNTLLQCELPAAVFAEARFEQVGLIKCQLPGCDFSTAVLRRVNFTQSVFSPGSFRQSSWENASLLDADFSGCDFSGASLKRCVSLGATSYQGCNFSEVSAAETGWRQLDLSASSFRAAAFASSDFSGSKLSGSDLHSACFYGSLFTGADCRQTLAKDADFYRAILRKVDFSDSTLQDANLRGADLFETIFKDCRLQGIRTDVALREEAHA